MMASRMVYLLNSLVTPINFDDIGTAVVVSYRLSVAEAAERAKAALGRGELVSAVGHEGTARVLGRLLGIEVKPERRAVYLKAGDAALQFFLKQRLPEGKVLTEEELATLPYWLIWSEVRSAK